MKKLFCTFILGCCGHLFAQPIVNLEHFDSNFLQWGYYFGTNTMDFQFDYEKLDYTGAEPHLSEIMVKKSSGFNVGLTGDIHLVKYLNLRFEPGLVYNLRKLYFPGFAKETDRMRRVHSTYIYIPLLLKYSAKRWYNVKPYLTAGVSYTINLSSNHKINIDNSEMRFRVEQNAFFYELGFGFDFYTPYFRFSPSIRGIFSLQNELIPDKDPNSPWTGNLNGIKTRGVLINLTFE